MPLEAGKSKEVLGNNIAELRKSGYPEKQAIAIAYSKKTESKDSESAREYDLNGWPEIKANPISKVGVFDYLGSQISPDLEPDRVYKVYRPESELSKTETIDSFKLLPFVDEHEMLGSADEGMTPAERKGIHGVIGEDVYFDKDSGHLRANLKVFSDKLSNLINEGKKELSIGYRCEYDIVSGNYKGEPYDAIQRNIRGNHLALVDEGRSGHDVAVLDHFKITFDTGSLKMPDYEKEESKSEMDESEKEMSMVELCKMVKELAQKVGHMSKDEKPDEEEKKEMSSKAEKEGDAKDAEPDEFVKKAHSEDADESEKEYEDKEAEKENKKMNEDEDMEKPDGKDAKGKGMDSKIRYLTDEVNNLKKMGTKVLLREISRRDALAKRLYPHIGTFDHSDKTLTEVAKYGIKQLGLICKSGYEEAVLDGYLAGARKNNIISMTQDSKPTSSCIDNYLNGVK
jgi:uncharacterized protein